MQYAVAEIQAPLVGVETAMGDIEGFVVNE